MIFKTAFALCLLINIASATHISGRMDGGCHSASTWEYSNCGCVDIPPSPIMRSYNIDYNGQTALIYNHKGCNRGGASVAHIGSTQCWSDPRAYAASICIDCGPGYPQC
ncbi:hypothetical protein F5H01DRAFT_348648 [Linnemannia elongata]|nr:hypothetical protein F5H01DRAFT_348648 [Linnemannia elongata]